MKAIDIEERDGEICGYSIDFLKQVTGKSRFSRVDIEELRIILNMSEGKWYRDKWGRIVDGESGRVVHERGIKPLTFTVKWQGLLMKLRLIEEFDSLRRSHGVMAKAIQDLEERDFSEASIGSVAKIAETMHKIGQGIQEAATRVGDMQLGEVEGGNQSMEDILDDVRRMLRSNPAMMKRIEGEIEGESESSKELNDNG